MSAKLRIVTAPWPDHEQHVRAVRNAVFTAEQGIAASVDFDGSDAGCIIALALDGGGAAIGAGRITPAGHIGRMAVLEAWRRQGVGAALLEALVSRARDDGLEAVRLNAQRTATAFYERHGFTVTGDPFVEAGLEHVRMERMLRP